METASRLLQAKFEAARKLFNKILSHKEPSLLKIYEELCTLQERFALLTAHLYIIASTGESGRLYANADFSRILASEDFSGNIDRSVNMFETVLRNAGIVLQEAELPSGKSARTLRQKKISCKPSPEAISFRITTNGVAEIQRLLDVYPRGVLAVASLLPQIDYEKCSNCGNDMLVDASRSELHCSDVECGTIRELIGTVFDDSQFYSQEGQKAKSGAFNPNRHFQFWWSHILAREPEEEIGNKDDAGNMYGEKIIKALQAIIVRDRKVLRLTTVNDMRTMLREIGRTDLNKNAPLVLKKLTGVGPPQISDDIAVRVENLFTKAIEISEKVRRTGRINRNYYPYYIYKILDQLLPEDDYDNRRVLYYIYVQSKETVESDDADWEQICFELAEISYVPTDRTKALKYHPI